MGRKYEILRLLDGSETQAAVQRESRGRILLAGLEGAGKSSLYNWLHACEVSPVDVMAETRKPAEEVLGLFTLLDLPEQDESPTRWSSYEPAPTMEGGHWGTEYGYSPDSYWHPPPSSLIPEAELVILVVDAEMGLTPGVFRWFCRLHARGQPLVIALNKIDCLDAGGVAQAQALEQRLAVPVVPISAREGTNVLEQLLPQVVSLCPSLLLPLGRDVPLFRAAAGRALVRQAALTCGLVGIEPVPLLDVPFQLAIEARLILQLAALYGRPPGERGGLRQEIVIALLVGVSLRYASQQLAKLAPMVGWLLSGLLSGGGLWVMGWLTLHYFEWYGRGKPALWAGRRTFAALPRWRRSEEQPEEAREA
ncbi:MAG: DUF697 domain-containing protein [Ardenticatenales bacterium]|nr:DUF697 domain-containing protein [Ardenticatenales bacterium]